LVSKVVLVILSLPDEMMMACHSTRHREEGMPTAAATAAVSFSSASSDDKDHVEFPVELVTFLKAISLPLSILEHFSRRRLFMSSFSIQST
jgi:hypothetical protein